jgi:hypothetical protein
MTRTGDDFSIGSLDTSDLIDNKGGLSPHFKAPLRYNRRVRPNPSTSLAKNRTVELWSQENWI